MTSPNVLFYAPPVAKKIAPWSVPVCATFFTVALLLQIALIPCLCGDNAPKLTFAFSLDGLYVARFLIVRYFHEHRGWLFYSLFLLSTPFWIDPILYSPFIHALYAPFGIHPFQS